MAAIAGKNARVNVTGTAVATTAAATTTSDNRTYTISNAARRIMSREGAVVVKVGGVATGEAYTLNRLAGTVTFGSASVRTVTLDYSYLPLSAVAEGKEFSVKFGRDMIDATIFGDAWRRHQTGLGDASGSIGQWHSADTYFRTTLDAGDPVVIEFSVDAGVSYFARVWALLDSDEIGAVFDGNVDRSVSFVATTDADGRAFHLT